ncbi:hypothetical protein [Ruminococcus sp.]|uniref:hypothetical protein n=1 Tax=Ruminococcus sp. TaxID=41978 RepID=UPI0025EEEBBB|nr:hypothetical protein [Ruminococcus sp.]
MSELLAEGFRRLFKEKRFYIVLAVNILIPAFVSVFIGIVEGKGSMIGDVMMFVMTGIIIMFISITAGMFIVSDFKNNTIRNKIIVGHSRARIYLANLIISLFVAVVYQLAYWLTLIGLGWPLMGFKLFPCKEIFINIGITMVIIVTFTCAIVFICNSLRTTGGVVLSIMMDSIILTVAELIVMFSKSKTVEKIAEVAIPTIQRQEFKYDPTSVPDKVALIIVIDIAICVVLTIGGILIFKKTDLK